MWRHQSKMSYEELLCYRYYSFIGGMVTRVFCLRPGLVYPLPIGCCGNFTPFKTYRRALSLIKIMHMKTDIQVVGFEANQELLDFVNDRIKHLKKFDEQITGVDVYLKSVKNDQDESKVAEMKIFVPGPTLYAEYQSDSFRESIMETVDKLKRQMKRRKELQNEKRRV
jgi:putative sigma-54 modulation protein